MTGPLRYCSGMADCSAIAKILAMNSRYKESIKVRRS
jgi:hypothetical protein